MLRAAPTEAARFWRADGIDFLHARYLTHAFAPHTHDGFVIGVIEAGMETFRYRGKVHYAPPGHIVLVNPGEMHTGSAAAEAGWTYRVLYPAAERLQEAAAQLSGGQASTEPMPSFPEAVVDDPPLAARLRHLHRLAASTGSAPVLSAALLTAFTDLIERHAERPPRSRPVGREHGKVRHARDFLAAHSHQGVTLEALAAQVGLSPYHLLRVFRRELGLSPHAYQIQLRVTRAKLLLARGEAVAEVAVRVGFCDQSHLGFHFKRLVGVTPGQFSRSARSS